MLSLGHYSDITWVSWCLKLPATPLFVQQLVQANTKRKHQSAPSLAQSCKGNPLVIGGSPHGRPVMWKVFPWHNIIMTLIAKCTYDMTWRYWDSVEMSRKIYTRICRNNIMNKQHYWLYVCIHVYQTAWKTNQVIIYQLYIYIKLHGKQIRWLFISYIYTCIY